ncbi:6-phosphogluconate dehydrogenase C-terminal domain-like protein [Neolentinus lepideus HHB14362 ss-1]|uniref:6-phosphogluconate dehydrogenase C-terminal domain-like protein n=1 Tax=Neolentinus lepideus HHB14362 ss-1 TaxID=1314782 RepID=A0A165QD24_9AGAM|nr:6-phosphogluconate dehydrogenase C-terminal domain-like protein [Neolentinus lepideus HHB14362 ss-1]
MSPETKDVLLIGFGAVGAIYALILQKSQKARVTVVARSNYDAINSRGMHIKSAKYGDIPGWKPDRLVKSVSDALDRPYSYVVVCTKYLPEVSATPDILRPLLSVPYTSKHPQPTYVLLQNGLNVEQDLYYAAKTAKADEEPRIISGSVWITTNLTAENIVLHGDFDRLTLGVYRPSDSIATSNTPSEQAVLDDFASIVTAGGGVASAVPDIQGVRFQKNLWNLAFSSFATLTGHPVTALFRRQNAEKTMPAPYIADVTAELIEKYTIPAIRGVLNEALAVGRAMGYDESALPTAVVEGTIAGTKQLHMVPENNHRASMLLDIENGRPTEVEGIVGEVVRMAAHKGVDVPRIETIYALLLVVQNQILRERGA